MRSVALLWLLACLPLGAQAQFEVATLKVSEPVGDLININLGNFRNGRLTLDNVTLGDCIKFAYGLASDAQLNGPDWIRSEPRFNIVAQAPPETPREDLLRMAQALLAERLHVVLRREQKEIPHLALVVAKGGTKMRAVEPTSAINAPQVRGRINHSQMPMSQLVTLLSRFERQTVVDRTGLVGSYEVKLEWAPDSNPAQADDRPALFEAIQAQLGLRLEARKAPLEVLVVERADKVPADN